MSLVPLVVGGFIRVPPFRGAATPRIARGVTPCSRWINSKWVALRVRRTCSESFSETRLVGPSLRSCTGSMPASAASRQPSTVTDRTAMCHKGVTMVHFPWTTISTASWQSLRLGTPGRPRRHGSPPRAHRVPRARTFRSLPRGVTPLNAAERVEVDWSSTAASREVAWRGRGNWHRWLGAGLTPCRSLCRGPSNADRDVCFRGSLCRQHFGRVSGSTGRPRDSASW
jgi:hypothetical protein